MTQATFNCPHCGALYTVTVGQRLALLVGRAHCQVCRREMARWNTSWPPTFHLVERSEDSRAQTSHEPASIQPVSGGALAGHVTWRQLSSAFHNGPLFMPGPV